MDDAETKRPLSLRETTTGRQSVGRAGSTRPRDRVSGSKTLDANARSLRRHATDAERLLWQHLRSRRLAGYKFRRQVVIAPYIADFVCLEPKLIVEADGGQHQEQRAYDDRRTACLEAAGYRMLRFWNHEILTETEAVLERIHRALIEAPSPQPSPWGRGS